MISLVQSDAVSDVVLSSALSEDDVPSGTSVVVDDDTEVVVLGSTVSCEVEESARSVSFADGLAPSAPQAAARRIAIDDWARMGVRSSGGGA